MYYHGETYPNHGLLAQLAIGDLVAMYFLEVGLHFGDESGREPNPSLVLHQPILWGGDIQHLVN